MSHAATAARRRRAIIRLVPVAAVLLLAGTLPWVTDGPLGIRLIATPLLVAGLLVGVFTVRLVRAPGTATTPDPPAGCGGCGCADLCGRRATCDSTRSAPRPPGPATTPR